MPLKEKEKHLEVCEKVIAKDLGMLKYVPINVIRSNADKWIAPFYEKRIEHLKNHKKPESMTEEKLEE